jgi:hypothetical protein
VLASLLLLGCTHGIHELGLGVLLLHLTVQRHHTLVPFTQRRAQLALTTRLLASLIGTSTLLLSLIVVGHLVSIKVCEKTQAGI